MFYWILRVIGRIILKIFFNFKVEGLKNIPKKSNFIVVANHVSFLDPFIISIAIPKKINWLAVRSFYNTSWVKWFFRQVDVLLIGNMSRKIFYSLQANRNLGLFPEGTRTHDGSLGEFRRGAAVLASKTGRPVLPCAILGVYEVFPRKAKFPKLFRPIKVKIGKPIYILKEFEEVIDDIYLQEGTARIRNTVKEMLDVG